MNGLLQKYTVRLLGMHVEKASKSIKHNFQFVIVQKT